MLAAFAWEQAELMIQSLDARYFLRHAQEWHSSLMAELALELHVLILDPLTLQHITTEPACE